MKMWHQPRRSLPVGLRFIGKCGLIVWGLLDDLNQWLKTLCQMS